MKKICRFSTNESLSNIMELLRRLSYIYGNIEAIGWDKK